MVRREASICYECADPVSRDRPLMHGQYAMKGGRIPLRYCHLCGKIISGSPSLGARMYHWWCGEWPWEQ
jgi:hypothetical protein